MSVQVPQQVVRIPFLDEPNARSTTTSKDVRFINGFFEPIKNVIKGKLDYYFIKRPGLSQNVRPTGGAATGRGVFVWNGNIYSVFGTQLYKGSTNLGVTMSTSTGLCKFAESRPGASTPYLTVSDGQALYCIQSSGTVTQVVTNLPANTRDVIYMDQYAFVLDSSCQLWNSAPDDPTSWDGVSFIIAQQYPGTGKGLCRQGQYICVFSEQHMQMFYDNSNASGSPLNNADDKVQQIGCVSTDTIQQLENQTLWVGNGQDGGYTIWMMGDKEFKSIGSQAIDRILSLEGTSLASARAIAFRSAGHAFYALTLTSVNRTFVYDLDLQIWMEWTDTAGTAAWPIVATSQINQLAIGQHATNGWIYNISPSVYQDDSVSFTVTARTPRIDLDTLTRKFVDRVDIIADVQSSSENMSLTYSDDDDVTRSTARTYDVSLVHNWSRAWGNFRRRSWQLTYSGTQPFRCYGIEMTITPEQ
jgi:hypothetical protein